MVEMVVFGGAILCGVAGLAAASSFHHRKEDLLHERGEDVSQNIRNNISLPADQMGTRGRDDAQKRYQRAEYPYEFWNTVNNRVPSSYGITFTGDKQAGPFIRSN